MREASDAKRTQRQFEELITKYDVTEITENILQ